LSGLQTFAEQLEANTEQDLKPGTTRAENEIQTGIGIGLAFPGGHIAAAREILAYAMARVRDNAARHIQAAEILAVAIKRALENYTTADQDTASRLAQVENVLVEAVAATQRATEPQAPPPPTGPQP
jgi:hypothetical protein